MTAALVSWLLSRWAWERKGRPDLLRETVPFWLVSAGVWVVLGLTSHYASVWAHSEDWTHWRRHLAVQGAYFLVNCVTFVVRFLIFHHVLFANKDRKPAAVPALEPATADAAAFSDHDTRPVAPLGGQPPPPPRRLHHGQLPARRTASAAAYCS